MYVHNINGHMNLKEIYEANLNMGALNGARPLLFSDSTWAGSGHFGSVALTDMWREWSNLRSSISMAMSFGMYGVSSLASDVCGALGPLDEELCGRWAQVSAFLPLIRNFYNSTYMDSTSTLVPNPGSEFYNFENYNFQFMGSSALNQRLSFTRYIYS